MSQDQVQGQRHLVIAAAGTGGHVMPGLAVAHVMQARGWKVSWIGTTTGMEAGLVAGHDIDFTGLNFQGLRGRGIGKMLLGSLRLLKATWGAFKAMGEMEPTAVFSTGGYIAVPVGWAAKSQKTPIVLMNCDADLLMSTRTLLKYADALACGFAGGARSFAGPKGVTTGNPVRQDITAIAPPQERFANRQGPLKIFVFGGSLGAQVLNEVVPQALAQIDASIRPTVLHQTGKGRDEEVRARYAELGVQAEVVPFIKDMATCYSECDLVICRAGATSVSELCAAGVPAILVPFVAKTTAHQVGNARFMVDNQAAQMIEQKDLTPQALANVLQQTTREQLLAQAQRARALTPENAAERVADLIEEVVQKRAIKG